MTDRIEEKYPALLAKIRQLARKGLNRYEIYIAVRGEGISRQTLDRLIRRCHITVVKASNRQTKTERQEQATLSLTKAQRELANSVAEALAERLSSPPFKLGNLEW